MCVKNADIPDPGLLDKLRTNPGDFYLDLHNKQFPEGVLRGQLSQVDEAPSLDAVHIKANSSGSTVQVP